MNHCIFLLLPENLLKFAGGGERKCLFNSANCYPVMLGSQSKYHFTSAALVIHLTEANVLNRKER
jgi:hypothetical protein